MVWREVRRSSGHAPTPTVREVALGPTDGSRGRARASYDVLMGRGCASAGPAPLPASRFVSPYGARWTREHRGVLFAVYSRPQNLNHSLNKHYTFFALCHLTSRLVVVFFLYFYGLCGIFSYHSLTTHLRNDMNDAPDPSSYEPFQA